MTRYHCLMDLGAAFTSILLLVVGAAIGLIPTYLMERRREKHALAVRWDTALYELCKDFSATVREFIHLGRRLGTGGDEEARAAEMDAHHAHLRGLAQQMRLIGSQELQQAARKVEHHVSWVRRVWEGREDEFASYYAGVPPEDRLRAEMHRLYVAARVQFGVPNPEEVASDEPIELPQEL